MLWEKKQFMMDVQVNNVPLAGRPISFPNIDGAACDPDQSYIIHITCSFTESLIELKSLTYYMIRKSSLMQYQR